MNNYYLIRQGRGNEHAAKAHEEGWVGVGFLSDIDLTGQLPDNWREFNKRMIPKYLELHPDKSKVSAGLACGNLWTVCRGARIGDRVLNPTGEGTYWIGEIIGDYGYYAGNPLPHRRPVKWLTTIQREDMSEALSNSAGAIMTAFSLSKYAAELDRLVGGNDQAVISGDDSVEDPTVFGLEKHLEDFLVDNWQRTDLGKKYDLYEEDGEIIGQQYPTEVGPIDILAVSKDKKEILVVELKKGRASDVVVGQLLRYIGYVQEQLADNGQNVRGLIVAHEDDKKLSYALKPLPDVDFMTYEVQFRLKGREGTT